MLSKTKTVDPKSKTTPPYSKDGLKGGSKGVQQCITFNMKEENMLLFPLMWKGGGT